jgi:hypothetical protein
MQMHASSLIDFLSLVNVRFSQQTKITAFFKKSCYYLHDMEGMCMYLFLVFITICRGIISISLHKTMEA